MDEKEMRKIAIEKYINIQRIKKHMHSHRRVHDFFCISIDILKYLCFNITKVSYSTN